ncbi:MAG: hypothetical protein ACWA5R_02090 [bacterium]
MKNRLLNFWHKKSSSFAATLIVLLGTYASIGACGEQNQYDLAITQVSIDERNGQHILTVKLSLGHVSKQELIIKGVRLQVRYMNEVVWRSFVKSDEGLEELVVNLPRHYESLCAFAMGVGAVAGEYKDPDLANNYFCF